MKIEIIAFGDELTSGLITNTTSSFAARKLFQAGFDIDAIHHTIGDTPRVIGEAVYGHDEETTPVIIGRLLLARNQTIATAESCTGGMIGQWLTATPGSSAWYLGGIISYANRVKEEILGIPAAMLAARGAVSAEVAKAMAEGVRRLCRADLAVAVTGIAGPNGGSAEKPVGTVYIGLADAEKSKAERFLFHGNRQHIRETSAQTALNMVRKHLLAF